MKLSNILEAEREAKRFLARFEELKHSDFKVSLDEVIDAPVQTGALRRASLDLTRALSKMRARP